MHHMSQCIQDKVIVAIPRLCKGGESSWISFSCISPFSFPSLGGLHFNILSGLEVFTPHPWKRCAMNEEKGAKETSLVLYNLLKKY